MDGSKELAYTDLEWAIGINRISLKIIGLWPDAKLNHRQKLLADLRVLIVFILITCVLIIPGILALLRVWGDMMAMTDNIQINLPVIVNVMKVLLIRFHKKDLEPVINMIVEDWLRTKTARERDIMIEQTRTARMIVLFGCIMIVISGTISVVPPILGYSTAYLTNLTDSGRPLLLPTYYLRDILETPYYEIVFVAQSAAISLGALSYSGIDTFLSLLVFHIGAQLEIIKGQLLNLDDFKDFSIGLAFSVKHHLRLLRCVDVIDNTFNLMLLALLMYFAVLFCLQGFVIVTMIDGDNNLSFLRMTWLLTILITAFAHMCLYCAVGEFLIAKGEEIFYAVYNYTWYLRTPNEAKNLMMLMTRAGKPLYITAGKIFPLTMSLFCSLIKTSVGYLSVLLAIR
ncbi:PREDICTED: odorant receptor 43a-like [Vollenhovia emeryi]|uniref:odorant receptor 43a-like n=1 Tax=Vollenhovia emeryi TaxID=411798 RepID=UPI0005F431EF|nr:PREDICTED: odorant receptor 43a-like [Vollenhovia emeryi]